MIEELSGMVFEFLIEAVGCILTDIGGCILTDIGGGKFSEWWQNRSNRQTSGRNPFGLV